MIVPMKKISLLCLKNEQGATLEAISSLGVMHVIAEKVADSTDRQAVAARLAQLERVIDFLKNALPPEAAPPATDSRDGEQIFLEAWELIGRRDGLEKELENGRRQGVQLFPWGDFSPELLAGLAERNIFVRLFECSPREFETFTAPEGVVVKEISRTKSTVHLALVGDAPFETALTPAQLPDKVSLSSLARRESEIVGELTEINSRLETLGAELPKLRCWQQQLTEQAQLFKARDGMTAFDEIIMLRGFVPAPEVPNLQQAALKEGWALLIEDPAADEQVPTLIKLPKALKLVQPLFQFLGISPGYREVDASAAVLVFFTIYFGIIVGDAGYGLIFLTATLAAFFKLRHNPKAKQPLRLGFTCSIATIVWGCLSGNFFGTALIPGIKWLTDEAVKNANMQVFCFLLAVIQMSLGHIWQALVCGNWRKVIGNFGWMLVLWGNCILAIRMVAYPGDFPHFMYYCYGAGAAMVLFGAVNWRDIGEVFNIPFSFINSFVDVLSYIRLFAVGMAGYYIAWSFNLMGTQVGNLFPGALAFGILIMLFGHLLNLSLCLMSVLVHGVRLNTLEFANHIGLSWSGFEFNPLKKITNTTTEGEDNHGNE